jgi:type III secretion system FlhB-like substrate exporter
VVAAGRGYVAAAILEQARSAGVPVHEDPEFADALAGLALGSEVPPGAVGSCSGGACLGVFVGRLIDYPDR